MFFFFKTLSEKSRELDKLRSEWTSQTTNLSSRHTQDLTTEREKALEVKLISQSSAVVQRLSHCRLGEKK